jgi:hypothetical protein
MIPILEKCSFNLVQTGVSLGLGILTSLVIFVPHSPANNMNKYHGKDVMGNAPGPGKEIMPAQVQRVVPGY